MLFLISVLYIAIFLLLEFKNCIAFSNELVKKKNCNLEMKEGVLMMGVPVTKSNDYKILVERSSQQLENNSEYYYDDVVQVSLNKPIFQVVYEVEGDGAYFIDGACENNKRSNIHRNVSLSLPSYSNVTITAVWAKIYGGVKLTESFHLVPSLSACIQNEL